MASDSQSGRLTNVKWLFVLTREETETLEDRLSGLFDQLRVPLFRYVLVLLRNAAAAEDVTQECFLRLFVELRCGKSIDTVKAWLFRVAHNLAIDHQRQRDSRLEPGAASSRTISRIAASRSSRWTVSAWSAYSRPA